MGGHWPRRQELSQTQCGGYKGKRNRRCMMSVCWGESAFISYRIGEGASEIERERERERKKERGREEDIKKRYNPRQTNMKRDQR